MDFKSIINWLLDPRLLAAVGGYMSYHYMAKGQKGYKPWLYAGGGAVAGYLLGRAAQGFLVQPGAPPLQPQPVSMGMDPRMTELNRMIAENQAAQRRGQTIDLDSASKQLPPPMTAEEADGSDAVGSYAPGAPISPVDRQRVAMDTASIAPEDMAIADSSGSYGDSLEGEGLGSFGGEDVDALVDMAINEEKGKRRQA